MTPTKIAPGRGLEFVEWIFNKPDEHRRRGVDVLPLLGAPRENPALHVIEASQRAAGYNTHIDNRGTPEFRAAAARHLKRDFGIAADPEREIIATNGAMNASFIAFASLLRADDEIIIPTPNFYYWNSIEIVNGVAVSVPCSDRDGWAWDLEAIEDAITPRTRAILFTNPCNPTGFMPGEEHLRALGQIAEENDLVLIEDQSYERFTHTGSPITSVGSIPGLWERSVIVYSFHKNYSMHGWRLGYLAAPAELIDSFMTVATWVNLRVNHISQAAGTAALDGPMEWVDEMVRPFREGRDKLLVGLADDPGITMSIPTSGGTMGYISVDGLGLGSVDVAERLLGEVGVPTVPGAIFGPARDSGEYVRIAFSLPRDHPGRYDEVVERLRRASELIRTG